MYCLSDVRSGPQPSQTDLPLTTSMLFKEVYSCLDVDIRLAGLTCNLLETSARRGSSELLSLTIDQLIVQKIGGRDKSDIAIMHVQVMTFDHDHADQSCLNLSILVSTSKSEETTHEINTWLCEVSCVV